MSELFSEAYALQQDSLDDLRHFREQFFIPQHDGENQAYFCGNSLGLQPKSLSAALAEELDNWAANGVEGHFNGKHPWMPYHEFVRDSLASVVGAMPSEVVAMNSLSVNLHLMMVSFYRPDQQRNAILDAKDLTAQIASLREGCFHDLVRQYIPVESVEEQWDIGALQKVLAEEWQMELDLQKQVQDASAITDEDLLASVAAAANALFTAKVDQVGAENFTQFERMVLLQSIDTHWRDHLSSLDYLRQGIHLRGYAQKQPKQEYKREAFELFGQLLDSVKNEVTKVLMTVKVQSSEQLEEAADAMESRGESIANVTYSAPTETGGIETVVDPETVRSGVSLAAADHLPRVGRNDPCPCGSGKKFKQCHGKLA